MNDYASPNTVLFLNHFNWCWNYSTSLGISHLGFYPIDVYTLTYILIQCTHTHTQTWAHTHSLSNTLNLGIVSWNTYWNINIAKRHILIHNFSGKYFFHQFFCPFPTVRVMYQGLVLMKLEQCRLPETAMEFEILIPAG